ncbi:Putative glycoside hydrolase, family 42, beta-galactosidase trimerization [Septoria linicola]|uniref:beta-galactosidase n=1 Tax=Septoria linicola TaxID=215465 RepID=A0A9Q9ARS3_9PEZI|nr:Putative glycoside hydrolase, family 42, beta-galactosidase trimerization [Septoria linicola]
MRASSTTLVALVWQTAAAGSLLRNDAREVQAVSNSSGLLEQSRWPAGLHLAVDYYPSQWPEWMWESDLARMAASNISFVRVNEFDWSVLEPEEGQYNFTLLDKTLELVEKHGLRAIVGTPTAAPPNWLTEKYDVNFVDRTNTTLLFGSRRHYSFSSFDYREQSQLITIKLAQRYGNHSGVVGWQLDNEFGCHDTVRSYDKDAKTRFRTWLQDKYTTIENMNEAQGRVFWSSQYASFDAVEPPFLEVYTNNEAHTLDWYTFSSDMVVEFAKEQTDIIRKYAPTHAITHNFMVFFTDFDHHKFVREVGIDISTFDEYPLAGTGAVPLSDQQMFDYLRTGVPDLQALQHALYRGVSGEAYGKNHGPFGVMEMQPGVLNWNQYRVSPLEGMVRLWTHETFAASGDLVNYFRWRQVPYAQEQTLSGLFVSDNTEDQGYLESQAFAQKDLPRLLNSSQDLSTGAGEQQADVALVFDYPSHWVWAIEPYSGSWSVKDAGYTDTTLTYTTLFYTFYSALRRLGLSVDIISPDQSLTGYKLVIVPSLPIIPDAFEKSLAEFTSSNGSVIFGPHTGSRTKDFAYVPGLNPAGSKILKEKLPMRVTRIETPPTYAQSGVSYSGDTYNISSWEEWLTCSRSNSSSNATVTYTSRHRPADSPAACAQNNLHYLGFNPPVEFLISYLGKVAKKAGVKDLLGRDAGKENDLGATLRFARRGDLLWAFNYGWEKQEAPKVDGDVVVGEGGVGLRALG